MAQPSISITEAASMCAATWPSEQAARAQATVLAEDGYRVQDHRPPRASIHRSGWRAAAVHEPGTGRYVGDLWFTRNHLGEIMPTEIGHPANGGRSTEPDGAAAAAAMAAADKAAAAARDAEQARQRGKLK